MGRTSYDWTDPSRAEIYSADPTDRRQLVVWIWYPAEPGAGDRAPYLPEPWAPAVAFLGLEVAGALGAQTGSHDDVFAARAAVCVHKAADLAFVADQIAGLEADATAPERMWRITSDAVLSFFAKHLDGRDTGLLDGPDPAYPELEFGPGQ